MNPRCHRFAALALAALLSACATPPATTPAPPTAPSAERVEWTFAGSTSFEQRRPGLGVSRKYTSRAGWADVYVYNLQRANWAPGVSDPGFAAHFQSSIEEVWAFGQRGTYADLKIRPVHDVKIGGRDFRRVAFQFRLEGRPTESFTYLTVIDRNLLKYRMSFNAGAGLDLGHVARHFIEENLRERATERGVMNTDHPSAPAVVSVLECPIPCN